MHGEPTQQFDVDETRRDLTFGNLTNGRAYTVHVRALYVDGEGPPSAAGVVWPAVEPDGTPRVDLVKTRGFGSAQPCWRNEVSDGVFYFCRDFILDDHSIPASEVNAVEYNRRGDVPPPDLGDPLYPPGGGNYMVHTSEGLHEGCSYRWSTNAWTCAARPSDDFHPTLEFFDGEEGSVLDFSKYWGWITDGAYLVAQVATCLGAIIVEGGQAIYGINYSVQAITDSCAHIET